MRQLLNEINKKNEELRRVQQVLWNSVDRKEIENELGSYCEYITFNETLGRVSFLGGDGLILTKDINNLPKKEIKDNLDKLVNDENELVRRIAQYHIQNN